MVIRVYVDGMNLYNRVNKPLNIKWVDLESLLLELIRSKFPDAEIEKIILFTAIMKGKEGKRQQIYLKALQKHSPKIFIKYGRFDVRTKELPVVDISNSKFTGEAANVPVIEEKGTDVNIASYMIRDATTKEKEKFDMVCLVTNDSDLVEPIEILHELGQMVILITPNINQVVKNNNIYSGISAHLREIVEIRYLITKFTRELLLRNLLPPKVENIVPPDGVGWFSN